MRSIGFYWLLLLLFLTIGLVPISAQETIVVTFPDTTLALGETKMIVATLDCPANTCNRIDIALRFDPEIILVNLGNTDIGTYFSDRSDIRVVRNIIDNEEGTVRITTTQSAEPPPLDSNVFLQLSITALEMGTSAITVENLQFDPNVETSSITIEDGNITVTEGAPTLLVLRQLTARTGPGTQYASTASLQPGDELEIVGTSADGAWFLVVLPDDTTAWTVSGGPFIETTGDLLSIPIVEMTPTPTPTPTMTTAPSDTPTSTPTETSVPTNTPTATNTPTETFTSTPSNTPTPTATATPIPVIGTANTNANIRSGDSTGFAVIGSLRRGETVEIQGVSSRDAEWFAIELPNERIGWIAAFVVTIDGDIETLPEIDPPTASQPVQRTQASAGTRQPGQPTQAPAQPTQPPANDCSVFQPQSPMDGMANGITTFYWTLVPGGDDYWVSIFNESGGNVALASTGGVGNSISIDTSTGRIGEGTFFGWEVTAFQGGQVLCTTRRVNIPRAAP
jgi:uncharacterized protein YraI